MIKLQLESPMDVGWIRINTQPVKTQLTTKCSQWIEMFAGKLRISVVQKLEDLDKFMNQVSLGLDRTVDDQNKEGVKELMKVMEEIRDVRKAMDTTPEIFEPLQKTLNLLKAHGTDLMSLPKIADRQIQDYLDDAPLAWEQVVKKTDKKKEEILPMQLKEMESLKGQLEEFFMGIREFRNTFRKEAPFTFTGTPNEAYQMMNFHAKELSLKEKEAKRFNELEELFELQVSKYQETTDTRTEIKLLKYVWDIKALVLGTFESWNSLLWSDIKTDDLEDVNKNLLKNLRKMAAETPVVKGWTVYRSIEEAIKTMSVILPLVNSLHSESMRDRHWKQLAKVCDVKSIDPTDPKFALEDIVKIGVQNHSEETEEIVELSFKELKIERKLRDIELIWRDMNMNYTQHPGSELMLIKPSEETIEGLEAHQLELQTMMGMGKFVEFFKDKVMHWQNTLGTVEDVIKVWVNVSRNWASLESIFLASADIRSQLPEDTKRFEGLDSEFKELMKDAVTEENVVNLCSVDGRLDLLNGIQAKLDMCQRSLNEYLDQKKKIFPRFYFVSNVALLDMLANGTNPPKIMKYLGDCYDSLDELVFVTDAEGNKNIKLADEMIAKDKVFVFIIYIFS